MLKIQLVELFNKMQNNGTDFTICTDKIYKKYNMKENFKKANVILVISS
jgi:hypothetical protein